MIELHKPRDFNPCAPSQGLKLHPYWRNEVSSVHSCRSVPIRRKASLLWSYAFFLLLAALVAVCSLDPHVRKLKFLRQGDLYFEKGKYAEANISYSRALQIDARFVEAHYKRAQCLLRQSSWAAAFQELSRTVDLQPQNWPAHLDLGQLLLVGGKPQEAKDRAILILQGNPKHVGKSY